MSCPSSQMRPAVGSSNPASIRRSVVLPQPDPPSSAKISPFAIERVTFWTAWNVPKRLETPSIRMNGATPDAVRASGDGIIWAGICTCAPVSLS